MSRLFFLALLVSAAVAYPTFWVAEPEAVDDCLALPTKKEGLHGAPVLDRSTTFTLADATGAPIKAACPGDVVTVTATFAEERRHLLTASGGKFAGAAEPACPNRVYTAKTEAPATTAEGTLTIPCNATGPIAIKVISAVGKSAAFQRAGTNVTVKALADCPNSACPAAANATVKAAANATLAANETLSANETAAEAPAADKAPAASPAPAAKSSGSMSTPVAVFGAVMAAVLAVVGL